MCYCSRDEYILAVICCYFILIIVSYNTALSTLKSINSNLDKVNEILWSSFVRITDDGEPFQVLL